MSDIQIDFAHMIGNLIKKVLEQNSFGWKMNFEEGYCQDDSENVFLRINDWPTVAGRNMPVEIRWTSSFVRYNRSTGELHFSPFENIYVLQGARGYANSHVWGGDGRLCRNRVLIEHPFALIEAILTVLLQTNTSEQSLAQGHPTPDSTIIRNPNNLSEYLMAAKNFQNKIKKELKLKPSLFESKEFFIESAGKKILLFSYAEQQISHYINNLTYLRR